MGRVINPDSVGKRRTYLMRSGAEFLRRLSQKQQLDDEARDLVAALIFAFREIDEGIDISAEAWEKRDYWIKAEELRRRWAWPGAAADGLAHIVLRDEWHLFPTWLMRLLPHFNDIKITKMTRPESEWLGSYARLMAERPPDDQLPARAPSGLIPPGSPARGD